MPNPEREETIMGRLLGKRRPTAQVGASQKATTEAPATVEGTAAVDDSSEEVVVGFIGEIRLFSANFAPPGWMMCDGQLLLVNDHLHLFSLVGTTYGGDGRTTFGLPDLRGRSAIGFGQAPGLPEHRLGRSGTFAPGDGTPDHGHLALNYMICLDGVFPTRT